MLPMRRPMIVAALAALAGCIESYPAIESTLELESGIDASGPYIVRTVVSSTTDDDLVELFYTTRDEGSFIPLSMALSPSGAYFQAAIPGQPAGTTIKYYVAISRDGARLVADPVGAAAAPYSFNIE